MRVSIRLGFALAWAAPFAGCEQPDRSVRHVSPAALVSARGVTRNVGARWTRSVPVGGSSNLLVSPDGASLAIDDGRSLFLLDARTGDVRAKPDIGRHARVFIGDRDAFVERNNGVTAYPFRGGHAWARMLAGPLLAAGDSAVFAVGPNASDPDEDRTVLALDGATGVVRSTHVLGSGPVSIVDVLPGDVAVAAYEEGEPQSDTVGAFRANADSLLWSAENTYLGAIDGVALLGEADSGKAGYRPEGLAALAAVGGRTYYVDHWFSPDAPRFGGAATAGEPSSRDTSGDSIAVDGRFVYVGVSGVLFRYARDADPVNAIPDELDGLRTDGFVVGHDYVVTKNGAAYELTEDANPALLPLAPGGASDLAAHAPYVTYRTAQNTWFAVDVERPDVRLEFDPPCTGRSTAAVAAAEFVLSCRAGSADIVAAYPLPRPASRDGEIRDVTSPLALATPLPQTGAKLPVSTPIEIHVSAARGRNDFRPRVVSPAARSIVTTIDRTIARTSDLHWLAPDCRSEGDGFTCTVPLPLPAQATSHTVGLTLFDGSGGSGNVLARGAERVAITGGPQALSFGIGGVPATLELRFSGALHRGRPASLPVSVLARDADGYPILNTAPYDVPVKLTLTGAGSGTSLSPNVLVHSNDRATLHYDGSSADSLRLDASAPNAASATLRIPIEPEP